MTAATIRQRWTDGLPARNPGELADYATDAVAASRATCDACGHPAAGPNPLVLAEGFLIHFSHTMDEASGFYGAVFKAAA